MSECEYVDIYAKQSNKNTVTVKRISGIYMKLILLENILSLMVYYPKTRRSVFERSQAHHKCNLVKNSRFLMITKCLHYQIRVISYI